MATINNFEDLDIWKNARIITKNTYKDLRDLRDFGFKDQAQRCAISIMNNIAEGFYRESSKEKIQFFNIARGSAGELKSMYYVAEDLDYVSTEIATKRRSDIQGLANGIFSFRNYLKTKK